MVYTSKLDTPLPWFPWYPQEWRSDRRFQKLTWEEKGLIRELIDDCYLNRTIPADLDGIAHLLVVDPGEIRTLLPRVMPWFEPAGEGLLQCPWIEKVRAAQDEGRLRQAQRRLKGIPDPWFTPVNHGDEGEKCRGKEKDQRKGEGSSKCRESDSPTPDHDDAPLSLFCGGKGGKGAYILVQGEKRTRTYTDGNGVLRSMVELVAADFRLIAKKVTN